MLYKYGAAAKKNNAKPAPGPGTIGPDSREKQALTGHIELGQWGNWVCACRKVQVALWQEPLLLHQDCFCDDCNTRLRIMQDRYSGPAKLADKYNQFAPNGAAMTTKILRKWTSVLAGEDEIAYFRSAVLPDASDFDPDHATASVYAKCCGSLILHHGKGFLLEFHSPGIEGFERKERSNGAQEALYYTYCCAHVGTRVPEGAEESMFQGVPPGVLCDMFCCSGILCGSCNAWCCCKDGGAEAFARIPAGAEFHMGKTIEYVTNRNYLTWPTMVFNDEQFVPQQKQMLQDKAKKRSAKTSQPQGELAKDVQDMMSKTKSAEVIGNSQEEAADEMGRVDSRNSAKRGSTKVVMSERTKQNLARNESLDGLVGDRNSMKPAMSVKTKQKLAFTPDEAALKIQKIERGRQSRRKMIDDSKAAVPAEAAEPASSAASAEPASPAEAAEPAPMSPTSPEETLAEESPTNQEGKKKKGGGFVGKKKAKKDTATPKGKAAPPARKSNGDEVQEAIQKLQEELNAQKSEEMSQARREEIMAGAEKQMEFVAESANSEQQEEVSRLKAELRAVNEEMAAASGTEAELAQERPTPASEEAALAAT